MGGTATGAIPIPTTYRALRVMGLSRREAAAARRNDLAEFMRKGEPGLPRGIRSERGSVGVAFHTVSTALLGGLSSAGVGAAGAAAYETITGVAAKASESAILGSIGSVEPAAASIAFVVGLVAIPVAGGYVLARKGRNDAEREMQP